MNLLIFETNVTSRKRLRALKPVLGKLSEVLDWTVDIEDIDHVLRIEATPNLTEADVIKVVRRHGFYIDIMPD